MLVSIFRRWLSHSLVWSTGLPDLVLWRPRSSSVDGGSGGDDTACRFYLVEVKCTDQLSPNQVAWLSELRKAGIPCGVVVVDLRR